MDSGFDTLSTALGLSPYQATILRRAKNRYDISRLAVCDGVVYAPHATRGAADFFRKIFGTRRCDAVAKNKILARDIALKNVGVWR
ncbi:hypothetical protein HDR66_01260 [bacterium]|nr:hypothetical protein [bacterium]